MSDSKNHTEHVALDAAVTRAREALDRVEGSISAKYIQRSNALRALLAAIEGSTNAD